MGKYLKQSCGWCHTLGISSSNNSGSFFSPKDLFHKIEVPKIVKYIWNRVCFWVLVLVGWWVCSTPKTKKVLQFSERKKNKNRKLKYFSNFFCIASPNKTLVIIKKKINKKKTKQNKTNQTQTKKSAFISIKMAYQPTVDPTWEAKDDCSCPRCKRHREAQDVTRESMERYNTFLNEAKLDTKNHQLDGMMWVGPKFAQSQPQLGPNGALYVLTP